MAALNHGKPCRRQRGRWRHSAQPSSPEVAIGGSGHHTAAHGLQGHGKAVSWRGAAGTAICRGPGGCHPPEARCARLRTLGRTTELTRRALPLKAAVLLLVQVAPIWAATAATISGWARLDLGDGQGLVAAGGGGEMRKKQESRILPYPALRKEKG